VRRAPGAREATLKAREVTPGHAQGLSGRARPRGDAGHRRGTARGHKEARGARQGGTTAGGARRGRGTAAGHGEPLGGGARPSGREAPGPPGHEGGGVMVSRGHGGRRTRAQGKREGAQGGRREGRVEGRGRGEELTLGSKSGDHRLQNVGHNREEREMGERGS
jgi:hypothetical protein